MAAHKLCFHEFGDDGFAGSGKTGEPEDHRFLGLDARPRGFVDSELLYVDIGRAAQREGDHPGRQRCIAEAVDEDECAGRPVGLVRVDCHGHARREIAEADLVQGQRLGRELGLRVDVEPMPDVSDGGGERAPADPHQVRAA